MGIGPVPVVVFRVQVERFEPGVLAQVQSERVAGGAGTPFWTLTEAPLRGVGVAVEA
jgi:hypothetical protein